MEISAADKALKKHKKEMSILVIPMIRRPRPRPPVKTSYNGTSGSEEVKQ